ncbi:peptidoglycan hydrolase-like protein with peptidoglycan-binding domain [Clostridium acetobutylicum]|uniref:Peptodoglycan-binding domain n=1 Tax=Clostridium acetobutylicum (strain ATCC 824 / DSM 792 / JCM 1419 / IAM 19013 / LMG 5710 / NBRC 13948 / NRRL B-527 / VKM B-1787 / 2291 / W) TaxID=272562 RepID=Q97M08_CLOAB|nr:MULTISPECIES: peptidoglycan-binding protein [Clostridium]AAK78372.1 Peptodoglycan-binding domain [Clostridium acetobutylicum ATCC 824]ADZ19441.1 Peptodoglycan-binding domain protein [Clostridium acetobutylicum EA 2018]AEI31214.1 peptodoglycan-binding domain-containing protein [Clostridium acetobutylicum DSM 1731]AWV80096.1 peptidoglycan-binding protein [Clostridium acetobutylicum]MBC2392273.1 peptidoglycan-binding protein [Clostridium acetobutylicum]
MRNLKMKALSLGIMSTVLISSTAFAATDNTKAQVPATATATAANTIHESFNYGPSGGPNIVAILNGGGIVQDGDIGYAVKEVQTGLYYYFNRHHIDDGQKYGATGSESAFEDGIFGYNTLCLVELFQKYNGLATDGKVGSQTWAKLGPWDL